MRLEARKKKKKLREVEEMKGNTFFFIKDAKEINYFDNLERSKRIKRENSRRKKTQ